MKKHLIALLFLALMLAACNGATGGSGSTKGIWDTSQWDQATWQ